MAADVVVSKLSTYVGYAPAPVAVTASKLTTYVVIDTNYNDTGGPIVPPRFARRRVDCSTQ